MYPKAPVFDLLRFCCIYFDTTTVVIESNEEIYSPDANILFASPEAKRHLALRLPTDWMRQIAANGATLFDVRPKLVWHHGPACDAFVRKIYPALKAGAVFIRPRRALMVVANGRIADFVSFEGVPELDPWALQVGDVPHPIVQGNLSGVSVSGRAFEVALPLIRDVSFGDLMSIVEENRDRIVLVRNLLQDVARDAEAQSIPLSKAHSKFIDPMIRELEAGMRESYRQVRRGTANVGFFALSLVFVSLDATLPATLSAMALGGNLAFGVYDDWSKGREQAGENPVYMLWRVRKLTSGQ